MRTLIRKLKNILFFSSILLFFAFNFQGNPPQGWYLQTLPVNDQINDLFFLDSLNGWSVTAGNTNANDTAYILHTTNGGDNWSIQFAQPLNLTKIQFTDNNTGYAGGGTGSGTKYLYKTINGGTNWNRILGSSGVGTLVKDMQFINSDTGWYCDDDIFDGSLFKTTNGGVNWVRQLDQNFSIAALDFPSKDTGYAINSQNLYKTTNGGANWNLQYAFSSGSLLDLCFPVKDTGWIVGTGTNGIVRTINGGNNWSSVNNPPLFGNAKLFFINNKTGWCGSGLNRFSATKDGINWGYQTVPAGSFYSVFFVDSSVGWAGTSKLIKTNDGGGTITSAIENNSEVVNNFILYQNYPNPFNPSTTINYELKISNYVTLNVFGLNGREIQTLVNKKQTAGNYSVQFNGTNLSSGIYFYTIEINSGKEVFKDTKKMIMIK